MSRSQRLIQLLEAGWKVDGELVIPTVSFKDIDKREKQLNDFAKSVRKKRFNKFSEESVFKFLKEIKDVSTRILDDLEDFTKYDVGVGRKYYKGSKLPDQIMGYYRKLSEVLYDEVYQLEERIPHAFHKMNHEREKNLELLRSNSEVSGHPALDFFINNTLKNFGAGDYRHKRLSTYVKRFYKSIREFLSLREKYLKDGEEEIETFGVEKIFRVGSLTFNNYAELPVVRIAAWKRNLKKGLSLLKKYLPEVLYGEIVISDEERKFVGDSSGKEYTSGGTYFPSLDKVFLYTSLDGKGEVISDVLIHELTHRYYYKFMNKEQRARYHHYFVDLRSSSVTDYANENDREDFAETMTDYILNKGKMKNRDARDRLEVILKEY